MTDFIWPVEQALLDDLLEYFEEIDQNLTITSREGFSAGMDRARQAASFDPGLDAASVAALLFEGVSTRHPLLDGNKRLAWQTMTTFLDMNGVCFDAPEPESFQIAMAVVQRKATAEALAHFIRDHTRHESAL